MFSPALRESAENFHTLRAQGRRRETWTVAGKRLRVGIIGMNLCLTCTVGDEVRRGGGVGGISRDLTAGDRDRLGEPGCLKLGVLLPLEHPALSFRWFGEGRVSTKMKPLAAAYCDSPRRTSSAVSSSVPLSADSGLSETHKRPQVVYVLE